MDDCLCMYTVELILLAWIFENKFDCVEYTNSIIVTKINLARKMTMKIIIVSEKVLQNSEIHW